MNSPDGTHAQLTQSTYARLLGSRILSEANDLKRTTGALARDLNRPVDEVQKILSGLSGVPAALQLIEQMGEVYPIDQSDLRLIEDDCHHGVRIMRHADSVASGRVFDRPDKTGERQPYYEYRDTAMSRLAPYRPEWIQELRVVDDADPHNPDVVFNKGHFMHQYTLFVGPVNFYWGAPDNRQGSAMNTGDSFYITPFVPHTFANRSSSETAFILAVTFGAQVRAAQKELYATGERALEWTLDGTARQRSLTLLDQHLANAWMTREDLRRRATEQQLHLDWTSIDQTSGPFTRDETMVLAACLDLAPRDLEIEKSSADDLVVIRRWNEADNRPWPNPQSPALIHPMAATASMPQMRGCVATITNDKPTDSPTMISGLHGWVYNYSDHPARVTWTDEGVGYEETLHPGDSLYSQPFIPLQWSRGDTGDARLCMIRVAGALNLDTQRELSRMPDSSRAIRETGCWFDDSSR